jgi:NADPH:quinone reductase-like Zn-dependent oxidoreductase
MKSLIVNAYGSPKSLTVDNIVTPTAGTGQLQVRVRAASVNPADLRLMTGQLSGFLTLPFPYTPGNDFAGTITAVGEGVTAYQVGDEVFGYASPRAMAGSRPSVGTGSMA